MKLILKKAVVFTALLIISGASFEAYAYPTDGKSFERTGIKRLVWQREINAGIRKGRRPLPQGAQWPGERIDLKMLKAGQDFVLDAATPKDPILQAGLEETMKKWQWRRYNIALLDITDPQKPRFAGLNENESQTPGSVAKILVAAGMLEQLKQRFPQDLAKREEFLRKVLVPADDWAMPNSHEVPKVSGEKFEKVSVSRVYPGDTFSLYEWMDHALSPSSNAAATTLWREATLLKLMGEEYPPAKWDQGLYQRWSKPQWTEAAYSIVDAPMLGAGLTTDAFFLRLFFTKNASRYVKGGTSRATPLSLLQWLVKVEQGKMVDEWSSRELKRMLYLTRRRVRYLYGHLLDDCAAFFKSGSLFRCTPEPGFTCIQYQGNVVNALNALVEIETPDVEENPIKTSTDAITEAAPARPLEVKVPDKIKKKHVYMIAVMSNELRRNAAMDHAKLAEEIHSLIMK